MPIQEQDKEWVCYKDNRVFVFELLLDKKVLTILISCKEDYVLAITLK